ncbi:MAG: TldD/PmbA family protein [Mogibacterium sp.]|nr:TldD/PmbA family protein [Mogibacterium sp.]
MDRYIDIMRSCGADAWEITDTRTTGWEFYFIKHRLDQNRAKNVEHIKFKAYKMSDDGQFLGMASADVSPTDSDDDLRRTAAELVKRASLVKNKPYRLNQPADYVPVKTELKPLAEEAEAFIRTMESIDETDTEDLNSFELFIEQNERRLITSEGIDVTEKYPSATVDVVINARKDGHEIELYRLYELGSCDGKLLKHDIEELMQFGKDRLRAEPTPAVGQSPVVLSTDAALSVYEYFLDNMNAAFVLRGMSSFELGKEISDDYTGDRITLRTLRELEGSPVNTSSDIEGAPVFDAVLIENGVPVKYIGSRMFSQYMGLTDSFNVTNWAVSGGSMSADEIRTGSFLEIVEFSDFQVDGMTGDIFGEIRLAYYHDGKGNVTPVSGGSVSGSMLDNISDMKMSSETRRYVNAEIPAVTRLEHVTVAGA